LSIGPLPQFEADLAAYLQEKEDREAYEKLNAPSSIVVRFGYLMMVGEFPYSGESKPGCGSKLVVQTPRGTEIGEMLTSTCANSGCSKSVTRKEMLEYIENSGGRQYPFFERGRVLRIATVDDLNAQSKIEQRKNEYRMIAKGLVEKAGLEMKIIEAEPILGNERVMIYFGAEERIDFRDLVQDLTRAIGTKVELRQIGARDEARITADYERCGQYCCCKNFLKVLKPVSMKSAKIQKATLDPLKISGRCGRLMCCLRYEDETYDELRKNLPHRKSRVGTPEGDGIVISTQILTQLALVRLDNNTDVAIPVEELTDPEFKTAPDLRTGSSGSSRGGSSSRSAGSKSANTKSANTKSANTKRGGSKRGGQHSQDESKDESAPSSSSQSDKRSGKQSRRSRKPKGDASEGMVISEQSISEQSGVDDSTESGDRPKKKKRRRRKRTRSGGEGSGTSGQSAQSGQSDQTDQSSSANDGSSNADHAQINAPISQGGDEGPAGGNDGTGAKKKRKRRRRRRPGTGDAGGDSGGGSEGSES